MKIYKYKLNEYCFSKMRSNKIITMLVMILLFTPLVQALGITPGRTTLQFEENLEREIKFKVLNSEHKDIRLDIYATGSLAEYIEIPIKDISLNADEDSRELSYIVKLPAEMGEPGLHQAEIVVKEVAGGKRGKDIGVSVVKAVTTQLHVYVPYPGKYISAKLKIVGGKSEGRILFFVALNNFGEEDVKSAKAEIAVMDMYDNIINVIYSDEKPVPGEGGAELSAEMDPSLLLPGIYRVVARVVYDGLTTTAENSIFVGDFLLIPLDILVRDFKLGEIAKFDIMVENIGNTEIKDASLSLMLYSKEGNIVADIESAPTDFKPFEKKNIEGYWETEDVRAGEYNGKIILRYGDKSDEREIKTLVGEDFIKVEIIGVKGYAVSLPAPSRISAVAVVTVLLALINIGWFVFYFISKRR